MTTTPSGWTVLDEDAAVLTREYTFDTPPGYANSLALRLKNGEMLVVSAPIDPSDEVVADLEKFGTVGAILAENGFHYLGQPAWHARFPNVRKFSSALAVERFKDKIAGLPEYEPVSALKELLPDNVSLYEIPGTKCGETWIAIEAKSGTILYSSDMIANMDRIPSLMMNLMMRMMRSYPGFRANRGAVMMMIDDKPAAKQVLLQALADHAPSVVVCGHGPIVREGDLQAQCREMIEGAF